MSRFSFANLAASASIAASTTFADAAHPASNVLLFGRPHIRAYSADTSPQRLTLDFGSTTSLDVIALLNTNFITATIQGNATDAWGGPGYNPAAVTIGRSGTGRYHHAHRPTVAVPFSRRYASISIPNQATTDGAGYFKLGPVWAGLLVSPPRGIRTKPIETKVEARKDIKTEDGRTLGRVILGDPFWRVKATRHAANPTELAAWREIDRRWSEAPGQAALVLWLDDYPHESYVMRREDDEEWSNNVLWSEGALDAVEVTSG